MRQEQDKTLFRDYEIKNWNWSPLIYKLLAGAAVFNLLAIFVMGQAQIFTTRGCDSPMVSRVCQVLDTVYLGSVLLGTDSEYVSKPYDPTEIGDADITYIDVSGATPPLSYPPGYFALANPESQYAATGDLDDLASANPPGIPGMPGFPSNIPMTGGADLTAIPQVTPTPNSNPYTDNIPTEPFISSVNPVPTPRTTTGYKPPRIYQPRQPRQPKRRNTTSPNTLPELPGETVAENKPERNTPDPTQPKPESEPVKDVEINKKPLQDFAETILVKREERKPIDLTKNFMVVLDGTIAADGTFDAKKSKFVKSTGDEEMINTAKAAIEAFGRSGTFGYLKNIGVDKFTFTLIQDDQNISAIITSELKTPEQAKTVSSGFGGIISTAFLMDSSGMKKLGEDEKVLLTNAKATSKNKQFVLNFAMPKPDAQAMINRNLEKEEKKRAERKSQPGQTTGQTNNSNQRADK